MLPFFTFCFIGLLVASACFCIVHHYTFPCCVAEYVYPRGKRKFSRYLRSCFRCKTARFADTADWLRVVADSIELYAVLCRSCKWHHLKCEITVDFRRTKFLRLTNCWCRRKKTFERQNRHKRNKNTRAELLSQLLINQSGWSSFRFSHQNSNNIPCLIRLIN